MLHYEKNLEGQDMPQVPFNTLEYAKFLIDAGMERPLAEAQAEIQAKIISSIVNDKLATKDDINQQKVDSRLEHNELENKLLSKIDGVDAKLSAIIEKLDNKIEKLDNKIDEVDKRLSGQITVLANDISSIKIDINNLRNDLKTLETKIVVKMGGIVVIALTALSVIMKMCHF